MNNTLTCNSLEEVRSNIDAIDQQIVSLIAQRGGFVMQAARFKKTSEDVKAPQRVEQVISKVRAIAAQVITSRKNEHNERKVFV